MITDFVSYANNFFSNYPPPSPEITPEDNVSEPPRVYSSDSEILNLKKTLLWLYKRFDENYFFMIGAVVGRVSFKRFYELAAQYNIPQNSADNFIFFQLRRYNFDSLRNSDESFSDNDFKLAIDCLRRHTDHIKFVPYIHKFKSLKKFFPVEPDFITPLGMFYIRTVQQYSFKDEFYVPHNWARDYFEQVWKWDDYEYFDIQCALFGVRTRDTKDGKKQLNLCDLACLDELIYNEYKPQISANQLYELFNLFRKD